MSTSIGSRGANVKKLQEDLIAKGFLGKGYNTGYYGPLTEAAVSAFNKSKSLPATNTNIEDTDYLSSHPELNGTKLGDTLEQIKQNRPELYIAIAQGAKSGTAFTPALVSQAYSKADSELTPYYNEDLTNSQGALKNYLNNAIGNYNTSADSLRNDATNAFNDAQDKEGQNGTWSSSARDSRNRSLEGTYQNKFDALYNNAQGDIAGKLQSNEYNYGAANTPSPLLTRSNLNFSSTPDISSTSSAVYNPFNFAGRKNVEKDANMQTFTNNNLAGAYSKFLTK